ncbi:ATP synthase subunit I [Vibrio sonorensis]|uniref:ATP synthase subunit I n=1 Tax=Vibrio sonorensis TaxID=1004316 RepID=UPI0008DA263A|nr:ATP synthase subunit I [Vibrio sonorensis]
MLLTNRSKQGNAALKVVHFQLLFVIIIGSAANMWLDKEVARFLMKGGAIAVIGNYVYALLAFIPKSDSDGSVLLGFIFLGWVMKLVFTITIFVMVFSFVDVDHPGAMFSGYKLAILMFWCAPIILTAKNGIHHG